MENKKRKYIEGVGWRFDVEHSMHRRMQEHDYHERCYYMITMTTEGRRPILGHLVCATTDASDARIEPTALGREVERCWYDIRSHYPEVHPKRFQLMPDHIHGLLFVEKNMEAHLGQVIKGFKIGCSKALWRLTSSPAISSPSMSSSANYNTQNNTPRRPLFEAGYQDSILMGRGQLDRMYQYIKDNPRRLAIKRMNPDLFRVTTQLTVGSRQYAAIGNRWLLDRPIRMQVRCHNNATPGNLQLIERQKTFFLECAAKGAVIVSPCISAGEKEIARAVLDAKRPLIVILENGFPPMYKPPGKYFEACAQGHLLMLAPWPYHMQQRKITRQQCLALNDMAKTISTIPWTLEQERKLIEETKHQNI